MGVVQGPFIDTPMSSAKGTPKSATSRDILLSEVDSLASAKFPMSPAAVLKLFIKHLTPYEQGEILDFAKVYYFGHKATGKVKSSFSGAANCGYDDERGDYTIVTGDHVNYRYEIISILGKGTFG
jgi:dual specificity tyrosine-phosphorylation-regulated kinase 2/3/4